MGDRNGESSVEEILESIKKVIARENRAGAATVRIRRATAGISDRISAPEPTDADEAAEVLELSDAELAEDDLDGFESDGDALVGARARQSMQDNLAALAMLAEPGVPPQIVRSGETSLEDLTRSLLKPMLAQWLDANLPDMVEQLVRAEIDRIARKGGSRGG